MSLKLIKNSAAVSRLLYFFGFKKDALFLNKSFKNKVPAKMVLENICKSRPVVFFYYDFIRFYEAEQSYGYQTISNILSILRKSLDKKICAATPDIEVLAVDYIGNLEFFALVTMDVKEGHKELQKLAVTSRIYIEEELKLDCLKKPNNGPIVQVGYAVLSLKTKNVESQLYKALRRAQERARNLSNTEVNLLFSEFKEILDQRRFDILYQPIVSLRAGGILGWEALTRGPQNSSFHSPHAIFSFAEKTGLLYYVEKTCRRLALENLGGLGPDQKLFLNIHPQTVNDPGFVKGETMMLIEEIGLKPSNVVFEITEKHCIEDFYSFNKTLDHYRNQGYKVAVDDTGSGFSSLQSIAEIRPDFIKLDMSLTRNINQNPVKKVLIETFVTFAEKIGSAIIAEGIEEWEELAALADIGVPFGQGYFLSRPAFPKPRLDEAVEVKVLRLASNWRKNLSKHPFPISDITQSTVGIHKECPVRDAKKILNDNKGLIDGVVVVEEGRPVGLVMRYHLERYLSMQYGVSLYFDRPVKLIMDSSALVVEEDTPIETVSQLAMSRSKLKLYDYIIVTKDKLFKGVVSVQNLLDAMTRMRLETAKGANPLTGLPGNIAIEQELYLMAKKNEEYAVIYLDLDHFKSYNDKYGFEKGDRLIVFTASLLSSVLRKFGSGNDFLGHIGGDDFIIITSLEKAEFLCAKIARYFDKLVRRFYSPDDRSAGGVFSFDRSGKESFSPIVSVSMAIVECTARNNLYDPKKIAERAAQLKRYAKSLPGSVYVKDRRSPAT